MPAKRKAPKKSRAKAAPEHDALTGAARAIGTALGTLTAKAKALPPEMMALAKKVSRRAKFGKRKVSRSRKAK